MVRPQNRPDEVIAALRIAKYQAYCVWLPEREVFCGQGARSSAQGNKNTALQFRKYSFTLFTFLANWNSVEHNKRKKHQEERSRKDINVMEAKYMKGFICPRIFWVVMVAVFIIAVKAAPDEEAYERNPPFGLSSIYRVTAGMSGLPQEAVAYNPKNAYNIFINYELGMHCVGFDISYCCIIPPYNSVQAQAVRSGLNGEKPQLLGPDDQVKLYYWIRDNSYSEGNKMKYWQVLKDVDGDGNMHDPNENMANYVWNHLFIHKDLEGTIPENSEGSKRLHIGREIPVHIDSGPSGKSISGGYMDYAKGNGGNIVFTDSMLPEIKNVPLKLTSSHLWDALGLPLTAFNDSRRKGSIRTITDRDFQPYQYAVVQMRDEKGQPLEVSGKTVEFIGTEPVDISNCSLCHSGQGLAAQLSRKEGLSLFEKEYDYWKKNYPDMTEYMARLSSATIHILELHDRHFKTNFLGDYDPQATSNRLGRTGSINCADCHGDNMSGNLRSPRPGSTGYTAVEAKPLTEAVHSV
ncbi:MAG: hypothetical protein ACE144_20960, partial [Thermodesulfobacteriota bacterium]